jgi:hypothetical protein
MSDPTPTKDLTPADLANQLFDAALLQYRSNPREGLRQVIVFLTEALVYAISQSTKDEEARRAMLKSVGESIATGPKPPSAP